MEPTKKPSSQTALLLQIVQDMAEIKADIKAVADHETRIRELEKARWSSAWLTGLLSSGISAILYIVIANQLGK
jgi:cell division protein FtsX